MPKVDDEGQRIPPPVTPPVCQEPKRRDDPRHKQGSKHLRVVPLTVAQANALIQQFHRHHSPMVSHRFSLGLLDGTKLVGACVVFRPSNRRDDQDMVAEVSRLVTDGTRNACSILYAAAARACQAMGFERIQTYILLREPGTSLQAAGWTREHQTKGHTAAYSSYRRLQMASLKNGLLEKVKWTKQLNPPLTKGLLDPTNIRGESIPDGE